MAGRLEDPNKLVTVACKLPVHIRDKFAGIALIMGDIKMSRRLERLILADIESVKDVAYRPFSPSKTSAPCGEDPSKTFLEEEPVSFDAIHDEF